MLIDKFGTATFSNGVLRLEALRVGPDGKEHAVGEIMVPGPQVPQVTAQLGAIVRRLEGELKARREAAASAAEGAPDPAVDVSAVPEG